MNRIVMDDATRWLIYCVLGLLLLNVRADPQTLKSNAVTWIEPIKDEVSQESARVRREVLVGQDIKAIVDLHNQRRGQEGANNMEHMKWNDVLAKMADDWAKGCLWGHGQPPRPPNSSMPFNSVGQNLYATSGRELNVSLAMYSWYDEEKPHYNYDTLECDEGEQCGHYTQVVWATSREVGCATHFCEPLHNSTLSNAQYLVCNYGPANVQGQKPYSKGTSCTKCKSGSGWCTNELCDGDCRQAGTNCECRAACQNGATLNSERCSCSCANGWHGVDCSDVCQDTHKFCNQKSGEPGWPPSWCNHEKTAQREQVRHGCPLMCKLCTPASDPTGSKTPTGCRITAAQAILIGLFGWIATVWTLPMRQNC